MRQLLAAVAGGAVLLGAAAPAAPPEYPVKFVKVDALKALLDRGTKVDIIDVRHWDQYVDVHIKGARSMPVRVIEERAPREISKTGRVVFY
jgi:rhodanese-related sulfurtransferase